MVMGKVQLFSLPKFMRSRIFPRLVVLGFLLILVGIGALPNYWKGNWPWAELPRVANIKQINALLQTGLELPGSKTLKQKKVKIGAHEWSLQIIEQDNSKPLVLLLLPQSDRLPPQSPHESLPEVEWVDINGVEKWKTDSYTQIRFAVESASLNKPASASKPTQKIAAEVEARFFRAWNQRQTLAVLQWYAWPDGGHPAPSRWFWLDQLAQLRRKRVPWIAVCLQIPMEPLGDLEATRPKAQSLGKMVQTALITGPFANQ
ncbi:MAG TPA: cyanoexosortase B system-associated protein [Cyanobacteria bacterium UBA8553]|nr:cyanoexosortase B system-associated protein [Cyanobacteria bacterium UBA8553]HAJ58140.1 cyanoexosortase B system-associated protein [Cyanobacteria bacterium UBA8543]